MTCIMTSIEEGAKMDEIMYINWKDFKSSIKWSLEWMSFEMNTIIKDGYSYTWNSMSSEGMKFPYSDDNDNEDHMEDGLNDAATDTDMDTTMSFKCKKWLE